MVKTLFGMNSPDWLVLALQLVTSGLYHKGLQLSFDTYGGHSLRSLQTQSEKSVKQQCTLQQTGSVRCLQGRTFTLQALFDQTPQQAPTVVTEGGAHVIVGFETVRHVNFKTLLLELWKQREFTAIWSPHIVSKLKCFLYEWMDQRYSRNTWLQGVGSNTFALHLVLLDLIHLHSSVLRKKPVHSLD